MSQQLIRTSVYVDGFNLYFGSLKNTPYKWLNILELCQAYLPVSINDITSIKYFTAIISARPNDPQQPARQNAYLRALATIPCVEIIHGHYLSHTISARLANPPIIGDKYVKIIKTEEKGSDVNLATHLLHDAHLNRYDLAVVISNDSDLLAPIKLVRADLGKKVGILNPQQKPSRALLPHTNFLKQIRSGPLATSQFPDQITDNNGNIIYKPATW
jgi:NYN domain